MLNFRRQVARKVIPRRRKGGRGNGLLCYNALESRQLLAVGSFFDAVSDTLVVFQTAENGNVLVQKNGLTGNYQISDQVSSFSQSSAVNLVIDVAGFNSDVTFENNSFVAGNVNILLGDESKDFLYSGKGGVGGSLAISGGDNSQDAVLRPSQAISIGGDVTVNLGSGIDRADFRDVNIGGDLQLFSANETQITRTDVVGDLVFLSSLDQNEPGFLQLENSFVHQSVEYTGDDKFDALILIQSTVSGDTNVNLRDNDSTTFFNESGLVVVMDSNLGGDLSASSTGRINPDLVELQNANVTGDLSVELGDGENAFVVNQGDFLGQTLSYMGGVDTDDVTLGPTSGDTVAASFQMGDGDDNFTLASGQLGLLSVNFAPTFELQNDVFVNSFGSVVGFPVFFENLQGFDHHFQDGNVVSTQRFAMPKIRVYDRHMDGAVSPANRVLRYRQSGYDPSDMFYVAGDMTIHMLDNSGTELNMIYGAVLPGNLTIELGQGDRIVSFDQETFADVVGNVLINGGQGGQTLHGFGGDFVNDVVINLGEGNDPILLPTIIEVGGRLALNGVNHIDTGPGEREHSQLLVGGNLAIDNRADNVTSDFVLANIEVGGDVSLFGSNQNESVILESAAIAGRVFVQLGQGTFGASGQQFTAINEIAIGTDLTVLSTADLSPDVVQIGSPVEETNPTIGGRLYVNLGGGQNQAELFASVSGSLASYRANLPGSSSFVRFNVDGENARANIVLSAGTNTVDLLDGTRVEDLRIDFAGGTTEFNNFLATTGEKLAFNTRFLNLAGFNVLTNRVIDNTHFQQVDDIGPIGSDAALIIESGSEISSAGVDQIWGQHIALGGQITQSYLFNTTASVSVRLMDGSETPLGVIIGTPLEGSLRANLGDGERNMDVLSTVTGATNPIGIATRIVAGEGDQVVNLASNEASVSADYRSTYLTTISLGDGYDTLLHDNNVHVGGALIVQGVNQYTNLNLLNVGYNMSFVVGEEFESTLFNNLGTIHVNNKFNYFGGAAIDEVRLNDQMTVGRSAFVDLGLGGSGAFATQSLTIGDSQFGSLTILAGQASGSNRLDMSVEATVDDGLFVNFNNDSYNAINVAGNVLAGSVIIRGGNGPDSIMFGVNADHADAKIQTFDGSDLVHLADDTDVTSLWINFGNEFDEFFSEFGGAEPFDLELVNLP